MANFENEFSWSKLRDGVFNECKRRYYFEKYGFWGGWDPTAPERVRELYILKNLLTSYIWIGQIVHDIICYFLFELKRGNYLTLSNLLFKLKNRMEEDYKSSETGLYKKFPKRKCGLREHEYNLEISPKEKFLELVEKCITNFYNSDVLKEIKKVDPKKWIIIESALEPDPNCPQSFDFEETKIWLKIDFAIKDDNKIILYDWKTGKERDVKMDIQLGCYSLYLMQKFNIKPENIVFKKYNVSLDKEDQFEVTPKMIEDIKDYMRKSINSMKELLADKEKNIAKEEDFSKTQKVSNCIYCNFQKICEIV